MNSNIATLFRTAQLDYETGPDAYELHVTCADSSGSISDSTVVPIIPVNEHSPVVSPNPITVHISEVTPAGTVLASQSDPQALETFSASDQDRGNDGVLEFKFSALTDDAIVFAHFSINATDGTITLTNVFDVDNEYRSVLTVEVVVCDGEREDNQCRVWIVDIIISSVNEFTPQFSQGMYTTVNQEYDEGEYGDELIATVSCTDGDTGAGELNGIELANSPAPLRLVKVSNEQSDVVLSGSLDSDMIRAQELVVELVCSDSGNPPKSATSTLLIRVKDLDDNLPQFTQPLYEVDVRETLSVGNQVEGVACTDADYGAGELEGVRLLNASDVVTRTFDIDPRTGGITLREKLDFDAGYQSYLFSVVCSDSAGNEVTARVNLSVVPANDEPVQFTMSEYEFSIDRLMLPGGVVGRVETTDGDLDPQQVISYTIEDNRHFSIDSSGEIVLESFILIAEGDRFRLRVTASDGANEEAGAVVVVTVDGALSVLDIVLIIAGALVLAGLVIGLPCGVYCIRRK